jgi:hypothetical protein
MTLKRQTMVHESIAGEMTIMDEVPGLRLLVDTGHVADWGGDPIEMLEFAGHAYLMGNSPDDLRDRGWQMTMGNDDNGVASAIETALNGLNGLE